MAKIIVFIVFCCCLLTAVRSTCFRTSCGSRAKCTGNKPAFQTSNTYYCCACDNACYETFQDCCPDFVKTCGEQRGRDEEGKEVWKCVALPKSILGTKSCSIRGPKGIWMLQSCRSGWPLDETRAKCVNASQEFSYPMENFLPVVGQNGFTFRNKHCALCNGENNYTTWEVKVKALVTPPRHFNFDSKLRFVLANGGNIENIFARRATTSLLCWGELQRQLYKQISPEVRGMFEWRSRNVWRFFPGSVLQERSLRSL